MIKPPFLRWLFLYMPAIIFHQRNKCIGCHYCVDIASDFFIMDEIDGKASLINSIEKKGIFTIRIPEQLAHTATQAANICPVKIIEVRILK